MPNPSADRRATFVTTGDGATVDVVTLTDDLGGVLVKNLDGAAEVVFTVDTGADPTSGASGEEHVLPAAVGAFEIVSTDEVGATEVRVITTAATRVHVGGVL